MIFKTTILLTIVLTFLLINLGGVVHNTASSLACPDWPLCYGQLMPPMEGGVLIEHSHRLLGSLVGLLTIILLVLSRKESDPKIRKVAPLALMMVIVQGLLGGLTVIYQLPTLVSTAHLGLSMVFIGTLVYIHHLTEKNFIRNRSFSKVLIFSLVMVYLQMLLGAFVRHSGLGGACGVGGENSIRCLEQSMQVLTWLPQSLGSALHMSHRLMGVLIALAVIFHALSAWTIWGTITVALVIAQIGMGIWTVASGIRPLTTTLHLTVGTMLLLVLWKQYLYSTIR